MDRARRKGDPPESVKGPHQPQNRVFASTVDPAHVPDDLECPCCEGVKVIYRNGVEEIEGGTDSRQPTFTTWPGQRNKHLKDCPYVSKFDPDHHNETVLQAIKAGEKLLLNLNFLGKGKPDSKKNPPNPDSKAEQWRRDNWGKYKAVSLKSLAQYQSVMRMIALHGGVQYSPDSDMVMARRKGWIGTRAEIYIGKGAEPIKKLLNGLINTTEAVTKFKLEKNGHTLHIGPPRYVRLKPTEQERVWKGGRRALFNTLNTRPVTLTTNFRGHAINVVLINKILLRGVKNPEGKAEKGWEVDDSILQDICDAGGADIMAVPYVDIDALNEKREELIAAAVKAEEAAQMKDFKLAPEQQDLKTIWVEMVWVVHNSRQISLFNEVAASKKRKSANSNDINGAQPNAPERWVDLTHQPNRRRTPRRPKPNPTSARALLAKLGEWKEHVCLGSDLATPEPATG